MLGNDCINFNSTMKGGWLDNIRFWTRELSASEISADMFNPVADPIGLVGSWNGSLDDEGKLVGWGNRQFGLLFGVGVSESIQCAAFSTSSGTSSTSGTTSTSSKPGASSTSGKPGASTATTNVPLISCSSPQNTTFTLLVALLVLMISLT